VTYKRNKLINLTKNFFLLILIISCSKNVSIQSLNSEEIISLSQSKIVNSKSFSFDLKHKNGSTELPGDYNISRANGDIQKPNNIMIDAEIISNNFLIKLSYLSLNDRYWITNPISFDWMETPEEDNPFRNIDPINILGDIYAEIESIKLVEYKNKEYLLSANINSNNLTSLVGDIIIPNKNVDIELFITDQGFVRKILIFGEVQPNDLSNTLREISFSNWNVEIEWDEP
tara:strand:+ start:7954 stop:8643 length:690 start_codon:yes stop_codon:yes gene_type:complete